jgi:DNA-binding MarR family transcriptional regulator
VGVTRVTKEQLARSAWELLVAYTFSQRSALADIARELGLTPGHTKTILELDPDEGRSMGELATVLACDASNATWLVDRLEERGLVERQPHPGDRRVKSVVLTREGAKTRALLIERLATPPEDLATLDRADLEALLDALGRLPPHPPFWSPAHRSATGAPTG